MRSLKPLILFAMAFLLSTEAFLCFNIDAKIGLIFPASFVFALVVTLVSKPFIHLCKMLFDEEYRKHVK